MNQSRAAATRRAPAARPRRATATTSGPDFGELDLHLFREGTHTGLHRHFGAHAVDGGVRFALWAPNAESVAVVGDFNGWRDGAHALIPRPDGSGIWEGAVAGAEHGQRYKYALRTRSGATLEKADPFARLAECPPATASVIWLGDDHVWHDDEWMCSRAARNALDAPISIYEVHLGSWRRGEGGEMLDYRSAALLLAEHVTRLGFTHVELLPVMEHPFYGSWGYQTTGYFAPSARHGSPADFKFLVDTLHRAGIGVILDWVPSHFPTDAHGLADFDGTQLYEHADPRQGFHPDWHSAIFNYGRNEVCAFLLSSALFWLEEFHADALRVDAVASMLYLDYSRREGEWIPNRFGGRENLEAIQFLRALNEAAYRQQPGVQLIAEESTAWPMVSRPTYVGGLGFGLKWNMGWMHDTLAYLRHDPIHRRWHHNELTFSLIYAFNENFVLPLSHDEVVHGKGSLLGKMPGDDWRRFANLRLLLGYQWMHPGKKLLFMGGEFGQRAEWNHDDALEWWRLAEPLHAGLQRWVEDLNHLYRRCPALHQLDCEAAGFAWVDCHDAEASVLSFLRRDRSGREVLVVANFTPVPRSDYLLGVPRPGHWRELLNSDATLYGGSGVGNTGGVDSVPVASHGHYHALNLRLPPLGLLVFECVEELQ